ncbi:MAG: F0F1 ATP synthase subunit B [Candidatus Faecousia sp.]|nr:F0F1 ATP synthase subunit B [Clostridiales bacterium]MDY6180495.1 F0F1 ATP synthase subunit B [Candidatus Faecousia sp.]
MFESFLGVNPWTALFILLNTLTIFFVAKKFLLKPVMKIITERQQEIDNLYADAGAAKEQARQLQESYQQKLNAAQETSDRIVKEAVARGQSREEQIIRDANAQAAAVMDKASRDIAQEKKKAINDAKNEISDLAMAIAGKVVERELKESDQADLIDGFIRELGGEA